MSSEEELGEKPYRQLQKLAKERGIKANLPKAALVQALAVASNKTPRRSVKLNAEYEDSTDNSDAYSSDIASSPTKSLSGKSRDAPAVLNETFDKDDDENEDQTKNKLKPGRRAAANEASISKKRKSGGGKVARKSTFNETFDKKANNKNATFNVESDKDDSFQSAKSNATYTKDDSEISSENFEAVADEAGRFAEFFSGPKGEGNSSILALSPSPAKATPKNNSRKSTSKKVNTVGKMTKTAALRASLSKSMSKAKSTQIPRPRGMPNFAKLHAQNFKKMDTLNDYLDKKKDRIAAMTPGKPELAKPVAEAKAKADKPVRRSPRNFLPAAKFALGLKESSTFNFSSTTAKATPTKNNGSILHNITNKSVTGTPGTPGKSFDLKASLAKPLTYKPHTGKLQPWNPKEKLVQRQKMANRTGTDVKAVKAKQKSVIKGVRMNKRAELLLKKRMEEK